MGLNTSSINQEIRENRVVDGEGRPRAVSPPMRLLRICRSLLGPVRQPAAVTRFEDFEKIDYTISSCDLHRDLVG